MTLPYDPMTEEDAEHLRNRRTDLYRIDDWGRENLLWLWGRVRELEAELATLRLARQRRSASQQELGLVLARAEKAEARGAELRNEIWTCHAVNEGRTHPLAEREDSS